MEAMVKASKIVSFMLGGKMIEGEILKSNSKTVWVRVKDKIIKRHREKRQVAV